MRTALTKAWKWYNEASRVMGIPALAVSIAALWVGYNNLQLQQRGRTPLLVVTEQHISNFRDEAGKHSGDYQVLFQNLGARPATSARVDGYMVSLATGRSEKLMTAALGNPVVPGGAPFSAIGPFTVTEMGDYVVVCFTYLDTDNRPYQSDYYYAAKPDNNTRQNWSVFDVFPEQREKLRSYRLCD